MRREMKLIAAVCLCVLFLAGCGSSSRSPSGNPNHWQYTALGDSLAFGVLDTQGGYVRRYKDDITIDSGVSVTVIDLGVNGDHSGDLLNSLQNDSTFSGNISTSQVVTWDIGGDDLLCAINLFQNSQCGGADNLDCVRSAVSSFTT